VLSLGTTMLKSKLVLKTLGLVFSSAWTSRLVKLLEVSPMRVTLFLTCVLLWMTSCSTLDKGKQVVADAHKALERLKEKAAEGQAKFDEYMLKVDADRARFEQITGPWDQNGDGTVDSSEIASVLSSTAKGAVTDPSKRSLILDHWGELLASMGTVVAAGWLGLKGKKKAGDAIANAVTARQKVK